MLNVGRSSRLTLHLQSAFLGQLPALAAIGPLVVVRPSHAGHDPLAAKGDLPVLCKMDALIAVYQPDWYGLCRVDCGSRHDAFWMTRRTRILVVTMIMPMSPKTGLVPIT